MAGKPAPRSVLVDVPRLITAYFNDQPDPAVPGQRVSFGTSGHRGSSLTRSFNEDHILAITQAICLYRHAAQIDGPLLLGIDTHALSVPAASSALEVLAANGVEVRIAQGDEYTPTPVISHAILTYNRGRTAGLADGIVITPSHNPPGDGGLKYNPPHGGPAGTTVTGWIEGAANALLASRLNGVRRIPATRALMAGTTHRYDFLSAYVGDLVNVVDLAVIRDSKLHLGVDPLGGAGVHYWPRIAERYGLDLTVVSDVVDPTFAFMTLDWDGQIRMDPSSPDAMARLIGMKDRFDLSFACDPDHDRHGIVSRKAGLLPPNHYLSAAIDYLFQNRPQWTSTAAVGKTAVSSAMIDRVTARLGRTLYEVPVGFKWFVDGLHDGSLAVAGEESAGAAFVRRDGRVWTTDKDGIIPCLLAAEIAARTGRDVAEGYQALTHDFGESYYDRVESAATAEARAALGRIEPAGITRTEFGGEKIQAVLTQARGNQQPLGGVKIETAHGWFAVRPSGTEPISKIYAESFLSDAHLRRILSEAQEFVGSLLAGNDAAATPAVPAEVETMTVPGLAGLHCRGVIL